MSKVSAFEIIDINYVDRMIVVEDRQLGVSVEIPFGDKELKLVKVVEEYGISITYEDGSSEKKRFLD